MNAKTFVSQVLSCEKENWKNSDIGNGIEKQMENIAFHLNRCHACRATFDTQAYTEETLKEMEKHFQKTDLGDWTCGIDYAATDSVVVDD
jgi:hypothetical protein